MTTQKDKWKVEPMGQNQAKDFAGSMLKMAAVGLAGGIALIATAKRIGDSLLEDSASAEDADVLEDEEEMYALKADSEDEE